jgi:DNA polymerase I
VTEQLPGAFEEIWNVDCEYQRPVDSERPVIVCLAARELYSRREVRLFREALHQLRAPPFDIGPRSLVVAFSCPAEASCFYVLGWGMPANVLDLYAERLLETNGRRVLDSAVSLLGSLARYKLPAMSVAHKEAMRAQIMGQNAWDATERSAILDYCMEDVDASERLLQAMDEVDAIDWPRALWRGSYMWATAAIEHAGIPLDAELYWRVRDRWEAMRHLLIARVDADYRVFVEDSFNRRHFAEWLAARGIPWPRLPSGQLCLEQEVFKAQAEAHLELQPLRQLTLTLAQMRSTGLTIGPDRRNRFWLRPLRSRTGRNQPSSSANILGSAAWLRGFITPPAGYGLAIIDWSGQEIGIAAGRSGDPRMIADYRDGDFHMMMAILARLAPPDATKLTHPLARDRVKPVSLGMGYGMQAFGVSRTLGISLVAGREFLQSHRDAYPVFWQWLQWTVDNAMLMNRITAPMGWRMHVTGEPNARSLQNWPIQATGAEMLRAAVVKLVRAGLTLCATAHDAILLLAPLPQLHTAIATAREIMERTSLSFTRGLLVRTDVKVLLPGQRLIEPRGERMWKEVMTLLAEVEGSPAPDNRCSHNTLRSHRYK